MPALREPRIETIEGRRTLIVERRPPLPPRLDALLSRLTVHPIRVTGWRASCGDRAHRLVPFAEGRYRCSDGEVRDLRLRICADCEAVEVRDVTIERIPGLVQPRLVRRDHVICWYAGARRHNRTFA